jgi:UV DNA damage endonuclease
MSSPASHRVQLGLCCINTELRKKRVFCSRTMIRANFTVEKAKALALQNIADITEMCEWNYHHNIFVLRLSSDIFPHFTDDEVDHSDYDLSFALPALKKAGEMARMYRQRINFHPGQYNQIGAHDEKVFAKTCADLKMHADILDAMGVGVDGILCIHGGGVYGDKDKTIDRWILQFHSLPDNVKRRLCIENCERCYSVEDCIVIAEKCGIPIIFDSHHFECYNMLNRVDNPIDINVVLPIVLDGWRRRGMTPLFHIAEQRPGDRVGAHSNFIEKIPEYMLSIPEKYGMSVDIEVEAKMKEQAILRLYQKYPFFTPLEI